MIPQPSTNPATIPHLSHMVWPCVPARQRGFTLVELVTSMGIMAILLIGVSSAILIASKALPAAASSTTAQAQSTAALDQLSGDLACATAITELTATEITMTVADRGHGPVGPETIRWAWSGTSGAPLTRSYNGSTPVTIASSVSAFAFTPTIVAGTLTSAPRVLMIVNNTASLSSDENARSAKITAWGFPLTLVGSWDNQATFDAKMVECDVLYVTDDCGSATLFARFNNPAVGIVTENLVLYAAVGVSTSAQTRNDKSFSVVDQSHEIMTGFVNSQTIQVCTSLSLTPAQHYPSGTLASGASVLATTNTNLDPALIVIDVGKPLYNNVAARSRRVALPWGGELFNLFSFPDLAANPRTILKRSLVWAASPPVYDRVSATLTAGTAAAAFTQVELLNHPRVPLR